jgi:hypothetical protein
MVGTPVVPKIANIAKDRQGPFGDLQPAMVTDSTQVIMGSRFMLILKSENLWDCAEDRHPRGLAIFGVLGAFSALHLEHGSR